MNDFRFILEPYTHRTSRYTCPSCEKPHQFTRYVDVQTGEAVGEKVGRCNRITNCGYHFTPKQHFANSIGNNTFNRPSRVKLRTEPSTAKRITSTLSWSVVERSMSQYGTNAFIRGLTWLLTEDVALDLARRYLVGTARGGGTVFWQVDEYYNVRTGKIIRYDAETLKRIKQGPDGCEIVPQWAHTRLQCTDFHLRQCLFGQHILATDDNRPVAIVEAEKTAILCSAYLPKYFWLATGGCGAPQFKDDNVLSALRNREILLFPDTGATDKWEGYARELRKKGLRTRVSCDLDNSELLRPSNWDLADEFLAFVQPINLATGTVMWALTEPDGYPVFWDYVLI